MKRKKLVIAAALLAAGAAAYGSKRYLDEQREAKIARVFAAVRTFFASFGEIATVYVDQPASNKVETKGGVVMTDGRVYRFDYLAGEIFYQEESL